MSISEMVDVQETVCPASIPLTGGAFQRESGQPVLSREKSTDQRGGSCGF